MSGHRIRVRVRGLTIARQILEDVDDIPDDAEATYLVFYDWTRPSDKNFYTNLERINASRGGEVEKIQASVLKCRRLRTASALILLMRHFKMKANVFKAEEVNLDDLHEPKAEN
jgi:hypothetical protein